MVRARAPGPQSEVDITPTESTEKNSTINYGERPDRKIGERTDKKCGEIPTENTEKFPTESTENVRPLPPAGRTPRNLLYTYHTPTSAADLCGIINAT